MGSFQGHALPGTIFILFGLWTAYCILHRYYLCRREAMLGGGGRGCGKRGGNRRYTSTLTYPFATCPNIPLEEILVVSISVIGIIAEFITGFTDSHITTLRNVMHMTMYFFFGFCAVMAALQQSRFTLIPDTDYASAILAFTMEALIFYYHIHGRPHMDIQIHMFLVYVVLGATGCLGLEVKYRYHPLPALARAYFSLLQGTWFYQIGFILYLPIGDAWDLEDHNQMMLVTLIYTWHFALVFMFMGLLGVIANLRVQCMTPSCVYRALDTFHIGPSTRGRFGVGLTNSKLDNEQAKTMIEESDGEE